MNILALQTPKHHTPSKSLHESMHEGGYPTSDPWRLLGFGRVRNGLCRL